MDARMRLRSAGVVVVLAACSGRPTLRDPHEKQLGISVHNESGQSLCEVHIYLAHNPDVGHNWLQAQREIPSGEERSFWVPKDDPAMTYQVQVQACPRPDAKGKVPMAASGYAPSVFMNGPAHVVLFDEGNPASKETATGIAHANENTTLIPAKFARRSTR